MIIQPCPGCAATNQVQLERIAALEVLCRDLEVRLKDALEELGYRLTDDGRVRPERMMMDIVTRLETQTWSGFQLLAAEAVLEIKRLRWQCEAADEMVAIFLRDAEACPMLPLENHAAWTDYIVTTLKNAGFWQLMRSKYTTPNAQGQRAAEPSAAPQSWTPK